MITVTNLQKRHLQEFSKYIEDNNLSTDPISMIVLKNNKVRYISFYKEQETLEGYMTRSLALATDFGSDLFFSYIPKEDRNQYQYMNMILMNIKKFVVWRKLEGKDWEQSPVTK